MACVRSLQFPTQSPLSASKTMGKKRGRKDSRTPRVRPLPPFRFLFRPALSLDNIDTYQPCLVMVAAFAFYEEKNGAAGCEKKNSFASERGKNGKLSTETRGERGASFLWLAVLSLLFLFLFSS